MPPSTRTALPWLEGGLRALSRFHIALGSLSGLSTAALMLLIVPDVLSRKFFNAPIPGAQEISILLLVCKIFLGLPGAQASKSNFHVGALQELMGRRLRRAVALLTTVAAAVVFGLFAWATVGQAFRSTVRGEVSYGVIAFPTWPGRIVLAVGLCLLTLQLVADAVAILGGLGRLGHEQAGLYQATAAVADETG